MRSLAHLVRTIPDFDSLSHASKIRLFAWHLHTEQDMPRFQVKDVGACYDILSVERPGNLHRAVDALTESKPKSLLKTGTTYVLVKGKRDELDIKYGSREVTVQVTKMLADLPGKIADLAESVYLAETLICLRNGAFRASIVMCWNLAYSHFCTWILASHAVSFNAQWPIRYAELHKKAKIKAMSCLSDFSELKESEVIEITRAAGLISGNVHKVLSEKLTKRNMAAHPSTIKISHLQAEECIDDLINNVVLQLQ